MKTLHYRLDPTTGAGGGSPIKGVNFNRSEASKLASLTGKISKLIDNKFPAVTKNETLDTKDYAEKRMLERNTQVGGTGQEDSKLQSLPKNLRQK